jgi:hypothetical protein
MNDISGQIHSMAHEEACYWLSKATDHDFSGCLQKAIRILLAKE